MLPEVFLRLRSGQSSAQSRKTKAEEATYPRSRVKSCRPPFWESVNTSCYAVIVSYSEDSPVPTHVPNRENQESETMADRFLLTLSLLRVINVKILLLPQKKYDITR